MIQETNRVSRGGSDGQVRCGGKFTPGNMREARRSVLIRSARLLVAPPAAPPLRRLASPDSLRDEVTTRRT